MGKIDDVNEVKDSTCVCESKKLLKSTTAEARSKQCKLPKKKYRYRKYQEEQWSDRMDDLIRFRNKHGHCLVPYQYDHNQALAKWVKRQRYQYKLKQRGKHSTLCEERVSELTKAGFIWDSHNAAWEERYNELFHYWKRNGQNCNSIKSSLCSRELYIWIKAQRRQRLQNLITKERIAKLDAIGFNWNRQQKMQRLLNPAAPSSCQQAVRSTLQQE